MVRADTSHGMPDAGRRTVWVAEYTGGGSNVCTRVLQSQLCLKGRRVAKYQGSSSFAGGLMGAGDALGRDAQASSATRRNGVIYQGTEKGNVSEREVEERKSSLQDVKGEDGVKVSSLEKALVCC